MLLNREVLCLFRPRKIEWSPRRVSRGQPEWEAAIQHPWASFAEHLLGARVSGRGRFLPFSGLWLPHLGKEGGSRLQHQARGVGCSVLHPPYREELCLPVQGALGTHSQKLGGTGDLCLTMVGVQEAQKAWIPTWEPDGAKGQCLLPGAARRARRG